MHALPNLPISGLFQAWRADPSRWLPAALDIARGHGLPHANPYPFLTGTNLVVGLDGLVLEDFSAHVARAIHIGTRLAFAASRACEHPDP